MASSRSDSLRYARAAPEVGVGEHRGNRPSGTPTEVDRMWYVWLNSKWLEPWS